MKPYLHPVPIACVLIAAAGAVLGNVAMVVLGMMVAVAAAGLLGARQAQQDRFEGESLSADGRSLLRRISKQVEAIEGIEGVSPDTVAEARKLAAQVISALRARDRIKANLQAREGADRELGEARRRLEFANSEEEASLDPVIAARSAELVQIDEAEARINEIETRVHEAESILVDLKTRLLRTYVGEADDANLRANIARMRALRAGYEELDQALDHGPSDRP